MKIRERKLKHPAAIDHKSPTRVRSADLFIDECQALGERGKITNTEFIKNFEQRSLRRWHNAVDNRCSKKPVVSHGVVVLIYGGTRHPLESFVCCMIRDQLARRTQQILNQRMIRPIFQGENQVMVTRNRIQNGDVYLFSFTIKAFRIQLFYKLIKLIHWGTIS